MLTAPELSLRTPAHRCRGDFEQLFLLRYRERFGEGLRFGPIKTRLNLEYRPASASFGGSVSLTTPDLPDVTRSTAMLERLRELAEGVCQELDVYSRWVGRTGETDSPSAVALLPPVLARERGGPEAIAISDWLLEQLGADESTLIDAPTLLRRWPTGDGGISRRDLQLLSVFLASRKLGIEPDVTLGGPALTKARRAVLFRLPDGDEAEAPGPTYQGASLLLHLAAMVAAADGEIAESEERHLADHLESGLSLSTGERARLRAHLRWLLAEPPTAAGLKKRIEGIALEERRHLGAFLISVAGADGRLGADEIKVLTRVYGLLGLESQTIYSDVHQLMSAETAAAVEPVTVRPPQAAREGFRVPRPPGDEGTPPGVRLDLTKVRAKLAETERVADLLSGIFLEDEPSASRPATALTAPQDDFAVAGLDSLHSALLRRLAGSPRWERAQVERLANALGLLPDGALEVINEAAFEACGASLLEGDEEIEIDHEVLQEMLP